jgi:hypothetical protein|tara:strand:+ start:284 stop:436 length:153 start_codon:yes stop_codon:yes gene_type:complete
MKGKKDPNFKTLTKKQFDTLNPQIYTLDPFIEKNFLGFKSVNNKNQKGKK